MTSKKTLHKLIDEIPGDDGFWKSSTRDTFRLAAEQLIRKGFSQEEAIALLEDLYNAVREEFGG